jgi:3'-phosphoadenosine 5'-phosphosulfate sulfotransferase (PAPS reductase)/FAD synthetase
MNAIFSNRVKQISSVLATWPGPICVAYSGGKDSSAVIKLVASALKRTKTLRRDLKVVYCDTGVENPVVSAFVLKTLNSLSEEFARIELYDCIKILRPEVHQRFFVRLIGRGYPPPTQFFDGARRTCALGQCRSSYAMPAIMLWLFLELDAERALSETAC